MKKWVILGILILAALGVWFYLHKKDGVQYLTAAVKRGPLTVKVEATGVLDPVGNTTVNSDGSVTGGITVGAQVTGLISRVYVGFNTHVKKGQILALINPRPYQEIVDQDKANLASAEANLAVAETNVENNRALYDQDLANQHSLIAQEKKDKATLDNNRINYHREIVLVKENYDSRQSLDNSLYAYLASKAQVESDQALIRQGEAKLTSAKIQIQTTLKQVQLQKAVILGAKARLAQDETNLNYCRIVSPNNGIVIAVNTAVGQTVVSSFQSPNLFVIAKSLKTMQIDALVDEADIAQIHKGQTVEFHVDAYPNQLFVGKVYQIRKNPIVQSTVVNYDVIVYLKNPGEKLLPGMTADTNFIVAQKKNVLEIPNRALLFSPLSTSSSSNSSPFFVPSAKKNTPHVWVLVNGMPVRRNIKTGLANSSYTQVLSGLKKGNGVIVGIKTAQKKRNPFATF